ncbi:MAG: hypothetical protein ACK5N0_10755 [Synechococcaceae cyanobacterium]
MACLAGACLGPIPARRALPAEPPDWNDGPTLQQEALQQKLNNPCPAGARPCLRQQHRPQAQA